MEEAALREEIVSLAGRLTPAEFTGELSNKFWLCVAEEISEAVISGGSSGLDLEWYKCFGTFSISNASISTCATGIYSAKLVASCLRSFSSKTTDLRVGGTYPPLPSAESSFLCD